MFQATLNKSSIPLIAVLTEEYDSWLESQVEIVKNWVVRLGFTATASEYCIVPGDDGSIKCVFFGVENREDLRWVLADISTVLPIADFHLEGGWATGEVQELALGWALGQYSFHEFKSNDSAEYPRLYIEDLQSVLVVVDAIKLVRDLVNTPANHMMPEHLSIRMQKLSRQFGAEFSEVVDQELLEQNYPTIHAVGRASVHHPRLLRLEWGQEDAPKICLVGKGVCFDTGGLDIKPSQFMRIMKKDMGGAAHVLGLASMIMASKLPVRLSVLVPAADNAISGDAFRPGDVIKTRAGITVEIDNTDAEGRLVLCDALSEASATQPDLILDFATLTGAARVALGTEVPVFFSNTSSLSEGLKEASNKAQEPIWELPLHHPYRNKLNSTVADILNSSPESYGGAISAALFLNEFVPPTTPWAHFDIMAWNLKSRSGRPVGGEAMGLLAVFNYLQHTYS